MLKYCYFRVVMLCNISCIAVNVNRFDNKLIIYVVYNT